MKKQMQGIALILFGILLMLAAGTHLWIPIIDDISYPAFVLGLAAGIVGLIFCFQKSKE